MILLIDHLRMVLTLPDFDEARAARVAMLTCEYLGELERPSPWASKADVTVQVDATDTTGCSDESLARRCASGIAQALADWS
jgi:hypothetical protein